MLIGLFVTIYLVLALLRYALKTNTGTIAITGSCFFFLKLVTTFLSFKFYALGPRLIHDILDFLK